LAQGPPMLDEANLNKYFEMRHRVFLEQQEYDNVQRQKVITSLHSCWPHWTLPV
jgi:hypothetical protein